MNVVKKLMFGIICVTLTSVSFAAPVLHCTEQTVSVTVSPGDVSSRCGVILCWGDEVGGDTVDSWENEYVLTTNSLSSEGGTFSVSAQELGIVAGQLVRAFVVPAEVKVVEYVASDKSASASTNPKVVYFDTGVRARTGIRVEAELMWLDLADYEFCGGRLKAGDPSRIFPIHTYQSKWFQGYGSNAVTTSHECKANTRYKVDARLYDGLQSMTVIDVEAATTNIVNKTTYTGEVDTTGFLYLMGGHYPKEYLNNPLGAGGVSRSRCYGAKLYEYGHPSTNMNGTLVRDFVPVKDYLGHGAVYDRVNGRLHFSQYTHNGYTDMEYASCGEETGEVIEILQPEHVVLSSLVYYYMAEEMLTKVSNSRIVVNIKPDIVIGSTNALVICWGDRDYGANAIDWPNVLSEKPLVGSDGGIFTFSTEGVMPNSFVRAFLVETVQLVDWIASDANTANAITAYLDTGVKMKHGLRVLTRIAWLEKWNDFGFMGARVGSGSNDNTRFIPIYGYENGQWGLGYESGNWNKGGFDINIPYEVEAKMYIGQQSLVVDGVTKYTGVNTWNPDYEYTVYAFAVNYGGSPKYGCKASCYNLKMFIDGNTTDNQEGALVRDYVPAVRNGVGGMLDLCNGTFTTSAGASSFSYGVVTNMAPLTSVTLRATETKTFLRGGFLILVR